MIKIENVVLPSPDQWKAIIRGMRNPKNSWDRSDSYSTHIENPDNLNTAEFEFFLGDKDETLMKQLAAGGPVHAKYRRMIPVYLDITRPLYWWKEFDTYKVGTVANSCSTMHKIRAKEFELDDFSHEHLMDGRQIVVLPDDLKEHLDIEEQHTLENHILATGEHDALAVEFDNITEYLSAVDILEVYVINALNEYREKYLKTKDKKYWWQMIQLLPSSYNQKRTVMLNYEVLVNIYNSRRNHKLDEWHVFCDWIERLPYFDSLIDKEC